MTNADRRHWSWHLRRTSIDFPRRLAIGAAGLVAVLCAGVPLVGPAAEDHGAGNGFQEALRTGRIVPLERLIERIQEEFPGRILRVEVEYESHGGSPAWVYEVKMLTPDGHVLKLEFDAGSMELLELKGRHDEQRHKGDS